MQLFFVVGNFGDTTETIHEVTVVDPKEMASFLYQKLMEIGSPLRISASNQLVLSALREIQFMNGCRFTVFDEADPRILFCNLSEYIREEVEYVPIDIQLSNVSV